MADPRSFWNKKILGWEAGRYGMWLDKRKSFLERMADRSSTSLRTRQRLGVALISDNITGRPIVELGCGSGLLAPALIDSGAKSYLGTDISDVAIEAARARAALSDGDDRIAFEVAAVGELPELRPDAVVISLGLLDWLSDDELKNLAGWQGKRDYLHSISERRASPSQLLHRLYVQVAYGHRTGAYKPRYYRADKIAGLIAQWNNNAAYIYRDPSLSFGALVSSFPIGPEVVISGEG